MKNGLFAVEESKEIVIENENESGGGDLAEFRKYTIELLNETKKNIHTTQRAASRVKNGKLKNFFISRLMAREKLEKKVYSNFSLSQFGNSTAGCML